MMIMKSCLSAALPPALVCLGAEILQKSIKKAFPPLLLATTSSLKFDNYPNIANSKIDRFRHKIRWNYDALISWQTRATLYDGIWRSLSLGIALAYMAWRHNASLAQTALVAVTTTTVTPKIRHILYKGAEAIANKYEPMYVLVHSRFLKQSGILIENEKKDNDWAFHQPTSPPGGFQWKYYTGTGLAYYALTATAAVGSVLLLLKPVQKLFLSKYPSINPK